MAVHQHKAPPTQRLKAVKALLRGAAGLAVTVLIAAIARRQNRG
jgi:hypothetical protein